MTTPMVEIAAEPAPGPGARTSRGGGQVGVATIALQLIIAFGWLNADTWTPEQTTAASAAVIFVAGALHNAFNWWQGERRQVPNAVTVEAVDEPAT